MTDTAYRESEILHRLASGDPDAFTLVYKQYYKRIYYFAKTFLPDREDAEDITADTFVKLWDRRDSFHTMGALSSFLHITVRNRCFDFLRHCRVKAEKQADLIAQLQPHEHSPLHETREELLTLVQQEVTKMSAKMKEIFHLSYHEGLSPSEIAENLQVSVQTVSNQKTSVLNTLRKALAQHSSLTLLVLLLDSTRHIFP